MQTRRRATLWVCVTLAFVVAVLLLWRITPLARFAHPRELADSLSRYSASSWAPMAMALLFVAGGLVSFPLLVLIAACAMMFHPVVAFATALVGATLSAVATYWVAAKALNARMRQLFGVRIDKLSGALQARGVLAIAAVRMLPVGPFTLVNLAAGSIGLRMRDYILGTMLGLAPGIAAITAFGAELRAVIDHPTVRGVAVLLGLVLVWIAASLGLQRLVSRRKRQAV